MKIIQTKTEVLESFAKTIPNADKMLVDWGRDSLLIQIGQYSKEYSIKKILSTWSSAMAKRGIEVEYK